ncbi:MAG: glycosyltransferase family 2 protein [Paludibacteraceae bacterium]
MVQIKLSYIIPFYNGQDTIYSALNSIYTIDMEEENFEVIVVDDKSPVPASENLETFSSQHSNLRIIHHTQNKRQGGAKNTGIKVAKGEYIAFADQDDIINPLQIRAAYNFASTNQLDMLSCRYSVHYEDDSMKEYGIDSPDGMTVTGKEFCENHFFAGVNLAPWSYLYRREFLLQVSRPFEEHVLMEDADWIAWHLIHANKIGYYKHSIYTWIMNPSSITHSSHFLHKADWIKMGCRKIRDAKLYQNISPVFSDLMTFDGRENIRGGFMRLWKVDCYSKFYKHLGPELMKDLGAMEWNQPVAFMIRYPKLTCAFLYIIGPILKIIKSIRQKFRKV